MNPHPTKRLKRDPDSASPPPGPFSPNSSGQAGPGPSTARGRAGSSRRVSRDEDEDQNEDEDGEDVDEDLERHRKEAIYRQMLAYRRDATRAERRIKQLEDQRCRLEASVRAVEACWDTLATSVATVLASASDDALSPETSIEDTSDMDCQDAPALEQALRLRLPPTLELVEKVVKVAASGGFNGVHGAKNLEEKARRYHKECITLRKTLEIIRAENADLRERLDVTQASLDAAEKKKTKLSMETARLRRSSASADPQNGATTRSSIDSSATKKEGTPARDSPKPMANGVVANGHHDLDPTSTSENAQDSVWLRSRLEAKQREMDELRDEFTATKENAEYYRALVFRPPEDQIMESASLQILRATLEEQMTVAREAKARYENLNVIVDDLRDGQEAFKESVIHEARAEIETLRNHLRAKEADVARLRGQRDAYKEEVDVRKAELSAQYTQANEMKALADAKAERLRIFESEVTRLKSKLAAISAEEDYLAFLLQKDQSEIDYVRKLEQKVKDLESIQQITGDEAELKAELTALRKQAVNFSSGASEDKAKAYRSLELQVKEADASVNALYAEIDAMSKAYDQMEQIATKKVYNLKALEDAVAEARASRQKADHKYFAECRRITGLQEQQAALKKTLDLQRTAIEKAKEVENALHQQLSSQDKEITLLKNTVVTYVDRITTLEREVQEYRAKAEANATRYEEAQKVTKEHIQLSAEETKKRKAAEDEMITARKELTDTKKKLESASKMVGAPADSEIKQERDMLFGILRCRLCGMRFKDKILKNCLHTFCETCISDRVASRQRKCPTCMVSFAESDIKNLF